MIATEVISPWTVYLISRLDPISAACTWISIVCLSSCALYLMFGFLDNGEVPRVHRGLWALIVFAGLGCMFIPTTKEACAIYLIPKIANNESVQEIGIDIKTLAREWLEELRPAGKKPEPAKGE